MCRVKALFAQAVPVAEGIDIVVAIDKEAAVVPDDEEAAGLEYTGMDAMVPVDEEAAGLE